MESMKVALVVLQGSVNGMRQLYFMMQSRFPSVVAPSILWESYCPVHGFCSQVYHALVLIQQQKQLKEGAKTMKGKFGSQFGGTAHGEGEVMIAGVQGSWLPCVCR